MNTPIQATSPRFTPAAVNPRVRAFPDVRTRVQPGGDRIDAGGIKPALAPAPPPEELPDWTVLVYSGGDNELHDALLKNLIDCQKVGSTACMNVVAQFDEPGLIGCKRYHIVKSSSDKLDSPVVQKMGTIDMAAPPTLTDFVKWGMDKYPAKNYALIITSHGDAWSGAIQDQGSGSWMDLPGLATALKGRKLAVLGLDACRMASAENVVQLGSVADLMVASSDNEEAAGWPYSAILSQLSRGGVSPRDAALGMVTASSADQKTIPTLSAFDLSQAGHLADSLATFSQALLKTSTQDDVLRAIANATAQFSEGSDLVDFVGRLVRSTSVTDGALKTAAQGVEAAVSKLVIGEEHSPTAERSHGLTINLRTDAPPDSDYRSLLLSTLTQWDKVLTRIAVPPAAPTGTPPPAVA